ncbi:hypothetical protein HGRIS_014075 [Hohenbuehelia grisea]|uniref:Acetyl-CoA synthetase-like protein n=1 Tax=Hohenbuehelia grisea TaxID=104357 RepID=A0ABR3JUF4_9AGAR
MPSRVFSSGDNYQPHHAEFIRPPLDFSLTLPELYDFHYSHNAGHPLFVYDVNGEVQTITWGQAVRAIYRASEYLESQLQAQIQADGETPVVALVAITDQFSYFALSAGIIRLGCRAFPISPRNSAQGVANLLEKMGVRNVFVSGDAAMQSVANEACGLLGSQRNVNLLSVPSFKFLYGDDARRVTAIPRPPRSGIDDIAMILHSSGSTSFPKPIPLSHRNLLQWGMQPYYGEVNICGKVLSNHSLPFFHAMGVVSLHWAALAGVVLSNFAPSSPPIVSTPDRVYESATTVGSRLIFCVPSFLEDWSQEDSRVKELAKFDGVMFGGAPIQQQVGDALVSKGVKLFPFYGATELGGTSMFLPSQPPPEGWQYFKISPHCKPTLVQEDDDVYRAAFLRCGSHTPAINNMNLGDESAYDTNDLIIRHPTNRDLWKIYGRADDQIMHSTGEKTNPVPMETIINRHPAVSCALIFGRGRFQAGVLIEPSSKYTIDATNEGQLAEFRNLIWPSIEKANDVAPSHSRLFKEMIMVSQPSKPFQYTAKGTPRRQIVLNLYSQEIDEIYAAVEESSQADIAIPTSLTEDACLVYISNVVNKVMRGNIDKGVDLFQHGCDSLQATWIRNSVIHTLRQSFDVDTRSIPVNFVYTHPSIRRLSHYFRSLALKDADAGQPDTDTASTISEMEAMVSKYSSNFPKHIASIHAADTEVVLLTGSTGGLGSYILQTLLEDPLISRVYALNRADKNGKPIYERQAAAFQDRDIDLGLLDSPKLIFLEGDTTLESFGLDKDLLHTLQHTVTCIFHSAWRVDFNIALSSMESMVAGTRRLVDFALQSALPEPPRIVFVSSIGVVRNWTEGLAPEASISDASIAVGSGYPESKWVAERVLTNASERSPLQPIIVRVGQLSGGANGCWKTHEWVPSIVKSAQIVGCLPRAAGCISWIPVHTAAAALVEMRHSSSQFLQLVHPNPRRWTSLFENFGLALNVPMVPYAEWLAALEAIPQDQQTGSAADLLRLLDFFQSANKPLPSADAEAFGFPRMSTAKAVKEAPSLLAGHLQPLGSYDAYAWLGYWRQTGFLT